MMGWLAWCVNVRYEGCVETCRRRSLHFSKLFMLHLLGSIRGIGTRISNEFRNNLV